CLKVTLPSVGVKSFRVPATARYPTVTVFPFGEKSEIDTVNRATIAPFSVRLGESDTLMVIGFGFVGVFAAASSGVTTRAGSGLRGASAAIAPRGHQPTTDATSRHPPINNLRMAHPVKGV